MEKEFDDFIMGPINPFLYSDNVVLWIDEPVSRDEVERLLNMSEGGNINRYEVFTSNVDGIMHYLKDGDECYIVQKGDKVYHGSMVESLKRFFGDEHYDELYYSQLFGNNKINESNDFDSFITEPVNPFLYSDNVVLWLDTMLDKDEVERLAHMLNNVVDNQIDDIDDFESFIHKAMKYVEEGSLSKTPPYLLKRKWNGKTMAAIGKDVDMLTKVNEYIGINKWDEFSYTQLFGNNKINESDDMDWIVDMMNSRPMKPLEPNTLYYFEPPLERGEIKTLEDLIDDEENNNLFDIFKYAMTHGLIMRYFKTYNNGTRVEGWCDETPYGDAISEMYRECNVVNGREYFNI